EAVAIVVEPGCTGGPLPRVLHAGLVGDICKGTVVIIVIESARRIASDIEILIAVVVEVRRCHPHAVEVQLVETGSGRDVFKPAVTEVAIQGIPEWKRALAMRRFSTVYEKNVEQSVVVKIAKRDTSAHGFDEKSIGRLTTELLPGNSGLCSDVRKDFIGS